MVGVECGGGGGVLSGCECDARDGLGGWMVGKFEGQTSSDD